MQKYSRKRISSLENCQNMNSKYKMFLYIYIFAIPFVVDGYVDDPPIDTTEVPILPARNSMSNCESSRQPMTTGMLYHTNLKLYDSSDPTTEPFDLLKSITNLENSGFKENGTIKIIIPDWQEDYNETWITEMIGNYSAKHQEYNIIVLDWQNLSKNPNYFFVMKHIGRISADIYGYLKFLNKDPRVGDINKKVHIIGNGIGAHIAALVGSHFSEGHKIDRITGLDPASSGFENALRKHRLDKKDAKFVDVIHTCIDMIGIKQAIGDVDFYPNVGMCTKQPGCKPNGKNYSASYYTCGHSKAAQYMTQSISEPKKFKATQDECEKKKTTTYMGEEVDRNFLGRYVLKIK